MWQEGQKLVKIPEKLKPTQAKMKINGASNKCHKGYKLLRRSRASWHLEHLRPSYLSSSMTRHRAAQDLQGFESLLAPLLDLQRPVIWCRPGIEGSEAVRQCESDSRRSSVQCPVSWSHVLTHTCSHSLLTISLTLAHEHVTVPSYLLSLTWTC